MTTIYVSDDMDDEFYGDLHERVLRFMGSFAKAQLMMDGALQQILASKLPQLGQTLSDMFLTRIRDDQRLSCFLALARETGFEFEVAAFKTVYDRAKQTRDLIGHSYGVLGPVYGPQGREVVVVNSQPERKRIHVPDPLLPATFDRLTVDCEWIESNALRLLFEAGVTDFVSWNGAEFVPAEPPVPTARPVGGEPL
ncbi:hypothetical protein EK0264_05045 [Epidermidibacterium keratini]|uniref:Uncharacterized protein n=1 Tax=Epidermidibacterium keratini TaxID=1891644 RepID=A0A7L4YLK8_9ACTN|nr:hypothetical protein [Epidermidibacterium keratini]QHB99713.1 hypothetical protein EK0264_05045 [Epidermidibacterium keratini]